MRLTCLLRQSRWSVVKPFALRPVPIGTWWNGDELPDEVKVAFSISSMSRSIMHDRHDLIRENVSCS